MKTTTHKTLRHNKSVLEFGTQPTRKFYKNWVQVNSTHSHMCSLKKRSTNWIKDEKKARKSFPPKMVPQVNEKHDQIFSITLIKQFIKLRKQSSLKNRRGSNDNTSFWDQMVGRGRHSLCTLKSYLPLKMGIHHWILKMYTNHPSLPLPHARVPFALYLLQCLGFQGLGEPTLVHMSALFSDNLLAPRLQSKQSQLFVLGPSKHRSNYAYNLVAQYKLGP